jgi:hypothetical protein
LIPDVPDWVGDDAEPVGEVTESANLNASTEAVDIEASVAQVSGDPNCDVPHRLGMRMCLYV